MNTQGIINEGLTPMETMLISETMSMSQFLSDETRRKEILNNFIDLQLIALPYNHESNIESSLEYERMIAGLYPEELLWANQEYSREHVKRDCVYRPTREDLEVKTTKHKFKDCVTIPWTKVKGKTVVEQSALKSSCPDGLLFYRKFSIHERDPAMLGFVGKETLLNILGDSNRVKFKNTADVEVVFNKNDFLWLDVCFDIPVVQSGLQDAIQEVDDRSKRELYITKREILRANKTDDMIICNKILHPFDDARKKIKRESGMKVIYDCKHSGMSLEETFHANNYTYNSFVKKHYKTKCGDAGCKYCK